MSHRILLQKLIRNIVLCNKTTVAILHCKNIRLPTYNYVRYMNTNLFNSNKGLVPQQPIDLLLQNIRSAADTTDVLYNVQQHSEIMHDVHVTQALQSIFLLQKSQQSTITNGELVKHSSFLLLCKLLTNKVRFIELNEHLNALKVLSFVGVPSTNKVVQILLQLVVKQINDLSLQQIVFVDFILKDFASCPLVDALKIALPVVFEAHFRLIKDGSDVKQLSDYLVFAVKRRLSDKCIDAFVELISENSDRIDVDTCKKIVRTLCEARRHEAPYQALLHQCLNHIVDNINKFSALDLNYILGRLATNYNKKQFAYFYHEEFVNSCSNYVIENNLDEEQATWILKGGNRFKHMHQGLLDYISNIVAECPSKVDNWHDGMLVTLINGLAQSDYRPNNFDSYESVLVNNIMKLTNRSRLPWLRIALDLCTLNCWSHQLFEILFEKEFLDNFLSRDNMEDSIELLQLYQAVTVFCPTYTGHKPSEAILNKVKKKIAQFDPVEPSPLLTALAHGVGGLSYVQSNIYTRMGHFIDHVVVIRKGGYFVSINKQDVKNPVFLENINIPDDGQIVLVLYLTPYCYSLNTERILGHVRLNIRTLEAMGYSVIPVTQSVWSNLLDSERIPYLMQMLNSKCQTKDSIAASHT